MMRRLVSALTLAVALATASWLATGPVEARQPSGPWHFLASGDARNCGDIVMPGIAVTATRNDAAFYWHLGDLRFTYDFDEDITHQPEHLAQPMTISAYLSREWVDFIESQIVPFGKIPFMLGIGNHELVAPKTRQDFILQFADWLDSPAIREQRLKDDPHDYDVKTYFHWIERGVAFYFLDNASDDQFDAAQLRWFERVLAKDEADASVLTVVVGMHKALPESYSYGHSMNESSTGTLSGRRVYADLLKARDVSHKHVYVLASHSHFYMEDIYDTPYWRANGGVLPGWIVGTAGATRYPLPVPSPRVAVTNVYGSLLATVQPNGEIAFAFQQIKESDVPAAVVARYGQDFVHWCFVNNTQARRP